mgnify:CR=1 FL=1
MRWRLELPAKQDEEHPEGRVDREPDDDRDGVLEKPHLTYPPARIESDTDAASSIATTNTNIMNRVNFFITLLLYVIAR